MSDYDCAGSLNEYQMFRRMLYARMNRGGFRHVQHVRPNRGPTKRGPNKRTGNRFTSVYKQNFEAIGTVQCTTAETAELTATEVNLNL